MSKFWQIQLIIIAQFLIIACLDMSDPYWPLIVQNANPTLTTKALQFWSAAIYMVPFLITIITTPFWSHLGEKMGQKKMLLRATVALAITQFLICFITNPVLVLGIRCLQGLFAGFSAAAQAWLVAMTKRESYGAIIGRLQSATALGTIIGPIVGGVVATIFGYSYIFLISSLILSLVILLLAKHIAEISVVKRQLVVSQPKPGVLGVDIRIAYLLVIVCLSQVARWMSSSYFALYVTEYLAGDNVMVGVLYSAIALMLFVSAPFWGYVLDRRIENPRLVKRFLIRVSIFAALTQSVFAFSKDFYSILFAAVCWGACLSAIALIPLTLLARYANEGSRGKVIGLSNSASKLGNLLGVGLGALINTQTDFTNSFIAISLVYFLLASITMVIKDVRRENRSDVDNGFQRDGA